jgi:hypothetical protein
MAAGGSLNLTDLISVRDGVLTPDECAQIIRAFEDRAELTQHHDTPGYRFRQLDCNATDLGTLAKEFVGVLLPHIRDYFKLRGFDRFVSPDHFENVRIKKYEPGTGDQFKIHIDAADKGSAIRYLVFILYLNDNDGETSFPMLGQSVKPKAGRLVMFPPFWMFPHVGQPPTDRAKYIMMSALHHA